MKKHKASRQEQKLAAIEAVLTDKLIPQYRDAAEKNKWTRETDKVIFLAHVMVAEYMGKLTYSVTYDTIANMTGIIPPTVRAATRRLELEGHLAVLSTGRGRKPTIYRLLGGVFRGNELPIATSPICTPDGRRVSEHRLFLGRSILTPQDGKTYEVLLGAIGSKPAAWIRERTGRETMFTYSSLKRLSQELKYIDGHGEERSVCLVENTKQDKRIPTWRAYRKHLRLLDKIADYLGIEQEDTSNPSKEFAKKIVEQITLRAKGAAAQQAEAN